MDTQPSVSCGVTKSSAPKNCLGIIPVVVTGGNGTVPLTKIITKSMFVQRSRSNHTFESIGSVSIIGQSSISPISSFTCRSFNRLNHSYCFIDPFIPQKYEFEKRTKFTKVHKVSGAFYSFNLFI